MITINIEPFAVTSRGQSITVDPAAFTAEIWSALAVHGATQKIADAASGAVKAAAEAAVDVDTMTNSMMAKAFDALAAGEWSRRTADGVSEETRVQRAIMRQAIKVALGAKSPKWAAFTGLSDAEQNMKLDDNYAKNAEKLAPRVKDELKRREDAKKAKAKLADGVEFSI